jgi:hypothetical protein
MLISGIESRADTATYRRGNPDPFVGSTYDRVEDVMIAQNNDAAGAAGLSKVPQFLRVLALSPFTSSANNPSITDVTLTNIRWR